MLIAYMRGNKGVNKKRAADLIARSSLTGAYEAFLKAGMDEDPTPPQSETPETSGSSGSGSSSGDGSKTSSDAQDEIPGITGTIE
jgi:hypothetical protein